MFWEYFAYLPENGKFRTAVASDEEYAKAVADGLTPEELEEISERKADDVEVSGEGYSRTNEQLDDLKDLVEVLRISIVSMFAKGKVPDPKPTKRPQTAVQKEIRRRVWEHEREDAHNEMSNFGF